MHHHHRRRKKRPNYNTRTVEVSRGYNGFGFTISGQQPCILSCIVASSPADQAGLRAGDFLISVNGLNVSKLPHEAVVQLIGNSFGTIRLQIAENYFSDSSDEENVISQINRIKPRYLHHKLKMNRVRNSPHKTNSREEPILPTISSTEFNNSLRPVIEDDSPSVDNDEENRVISSVSSIPSAHNIIHSPTASTSKDISNVSAMVRKANEAENSAILQNNNDEISSLEYRAIVGYMGTIEMPKQIAISSKLQTVRSCIRKLRQEKRNPTTVLMTILPNCLILKSAAGTILATYPSSRLNYVSSSSESENRFFGLVTSAIYANNDPEEPVNFEGAVALPNQQCRDITISNSCHVFVIDTKICDHSLHEQRALEYQISCTKDPISNLCLEFPNNSEYVVNLIRSMYTMKAMPFSIRGHPGSNNHYLIGASRNYQDPPSNSPQPSNHSEVTTTSSNSDSGIGFHNDFANISDRILVVDFPNIVINNNRVLVNPSISRPLGICNGIEPTSISSIQNSPEKLSNAIPSCSSNVKSKLADFNTRLTVRAMPNPKVSQLSVPVPELLYNFPITANKLSRNKNKSNLLTTKSCEDVICSVKRNDFVTFRKKTQIQMSMDDISLLSGIGSKICKPQRKNVQDHIFIAPGKPIKKSKKLACSELADNRHKTGHKDIKNLISHKLSPKVFGVPSKISALTKNLSRRSGGSIQKSSYNDFEIWGSLQELNKTSDFEEPNRNSLEGTYSEPDLLSRALPSNASPFRRWGQSSFRAPRTTEQRPPLAKRPSSLAASENDVYSKSMDDYIDDLNSAHSQSDGGDLKGIRLTVSNYFHSNNSKQNQSNENNNINYGVEHWGNSFEKLLEDPAGLHTFAEFLKKEFSAENIYFWTACERYRHTNNDNERAIKAIEIFSKHLASGALEPVNVDSQARNITEENLQLADKNIFNHAQKQIFNLMKFDSYQRFIRSDLYKKCVEAEAKNQPLPYPGELLDDSLKTNSLLSPQSTSKLKKSASNAEDRRRKSLLPWHRKARCKSRDRSNTNPVESENTNSLTKSQSSGNNSLKVPLTNSTSDIHSSRSSLSSFDTNHAAAIAFNSGSDDPKVCTLCRIIFNDGATTIIPTRPEQTVRQLIERLLEKRGLQYQFFDVLLNGNGKSIDLENPSNTLAGKEVQIEQRVAFKLNLPDPKVISVKSKPKKALCDVLKPILHKYNYRFEDVQILLRDTHEQIDLTLPVTVADGQRLQVVMLRNQNLSQQQQHQKRNGVVLSGNNSSGYQNNIGSSQKSVNFVNKNTGNIKVSGPGNQQTTLDEITNKVFNELLQGKVDAHDNNAQKTGDLCSLRSDDCASETSSLLERMVNRGTNTGGFKSFTKLKNTTNGNKLTTTKSEDNLNSNTATTSNQSNTNTVIKKPLIAKWKTGVKLQVTARAHNQEEFLEGLKRAQRARLEDQRGTEINFELPDFLKDKANLSAANKLRKIRANLNPINSGNNNLKTTNTDILSNNRNSLDSSICPQPAPRLSITKSASAVAIGQNCSLNGSLINDDKIDNSSNNNNSLNISNNSSIDENENGITGTLLSSKGPPPLPPKPKILPIKPSNWGQNNSNTSQTTTNQIPPETTRRILNSDVSPAKNAYLDQPSSSFV